MFTWMHSKWYHLLYFPVGLKKMYKTSLLMTLYISWLSEIKCLIVFAFICDFYVFQQKKGGGISFNSTLPLTKCNEKMVQLILHEWSILADLLLKYYCRNLEKFFIPSSTHTFCICTVPTLWLITNSFTKATFFSVLAIKLRFKHCHKVDLKYMYWCSRDLHFSLSSENKRQQM